MEDVSGNGLKTISREEVLLHNQLEDCWLILFNEVYNVTPFLKEHPGGADILISRAGEDATSFFLTKHGNQPRIKKMLLKYKIGMLPVHQRIPDHVFNEPFIVELLETISREKLYNISKPTQRKFLFIRSISLAFFFLLSFLALYLVENKLLSICLVIVQAIIGTSLFGLIAHEATHRKYPRSPLLRNLLKVFWPVLWPFISQKPLYYEHNSHHFKIGDPDYDFEVAGFSDFIRYSGKIEHKPMHKIQHRMAMLLYPFYANIITTYGGAVSSFWSSHNRKVYRGHAFSLLITFSFFIIIPSLINGEWLWHIFLYLVYQCTLYYGIYVGAAINHFTPYASCRIPEDKANYYGYYVCANTTNFRTFHPLWFWYTGGFNVQIEHHLVPFIPVENLHRLVPVVKSLCRKYNYPYIEFRRFRTLWDEHYKYLRELSCPENSAQVLGEIANKESYQAR